MLKITQNTVTVLLEIVLKLVGVSSKHLRVFLESLTQSSEIIGNLRKMFGNVRVTFGQVFENLRKSPKSGWKSLENCQNAVISMSTYNKKNITRGLEDMSFMFSCQEQ